MKLQHLADAIATQIEKNPGLARELTTGIFKVLESTFEKHNIDLTQEPAIAPEEKTAAAATPVKEEAKEEAAPVKEEAKEEKEEAAPAKEEAKEEESAPVKTEDKNDTPETSAPAEEAKQKTEPLTVHPQEFGLLATTTKKHLDTILEKGGMIYRDKRSFMLCLFLEDELIAIAKTINISEFPEDAIAALKRDQFVSVDVLSFGPQTKRSRAIYTVVDFANFVILDGKDEKVVNARHLIEHGELPEHAKEALEAKRAEEAKAAEAKVAPVPQKVEAPEAEKATETEAPAVFPDIYLVNPQLKAQLVDKKDSVLAQDYGVAIKSGTAKLFTKNTEGKLIVIGVSEGTKHEDGSFNVKISDYVLKEKEDLTYAKLTLDATPANAPAAAQPEAAKPETPKEEESIKPEPMKAVEAVKPPEVPQAIEPPTPETPSEQPAVVSEENRAPIDVIAKSTIPADFPLTHTVELALHPMAKQMFSLDSAKAMVGQEVNLVTYGSEDNKQLVSLTYDVFAMATSENKLTEGTIPESKWLARIIGVDLIETPDGADKHVVFVFDQLTEVDHFPKEVEADFRKASEYLAIDKESFVARKAALEARKNQPEETPAKSDEQLLRKDYSPSDAKALVQPTVEQQNTAGYSEMVSANSKEVGGAVQQIRADSTPTPAERAELSGDISNIVSKTLKETNIHAVQVEKKPLDVQGNLQPGVGVMTQTETVVTFHTTFAESSWIQSVGKEVTLHSQLHFGEGGANQKVVTLIGKGGTAVAQGMVPTSEALLMDGNQHTATIIGIEGSQPAQGGIFVFMRLGNFNRIQ